MMKKMNGMKTSMATPMTANQKMTSGGEPSMALPVVRLAAWPAAAAAIVGLAWFVVALIAGMGLDEAMIGLFGAGIATIAMTAGLLIIGPWIARPVSMWMSLWLAGMMVRFVVALALAWVLYSATSAGPWALLAGVGGCYFAALLTEVIVLAGFMNRTPGAA
jgi:hypothetical protein